MISKLATKIILLLFFVLLNMALGQTSNTVPKATTTAEYCNIDEILTKKRSVCRIFAFNTNGCNSGTGFLISNDGLIMTNSHVVRNAATIAVYIVSEDGKSAVEHIARIVQEDTLNDLALIKLVSIQTPLPTPFVLSQTNASVLDEVIAIGFPSALDRPLSVSFNHSEKIIKDSAFIENLDPNITKGAISKVGKWLIHDAKISEGNSGGPLVSLKTGEVVGVNTAKTLGETSFYMAIPVNSVNAMLDEITFIHDYANELEIKVADGDIESVYALAHLLYTAEDKTQQNPRRALMLMTQAAESGHRYAMYWLGRMYSDCTSIKPNAVLAIKFLTQSGTPCATILLAEIYIKGIPGTNFQKNPSKGFNIIKSYVEATNDQSARVSLARCYRLGIGTQQNIREAINILRSLLEEEKAKKRYKPHTSTQIELAKALISSQNSKNIEEGLALFKKLATNEQAIVRGIACVSLSNLYFQGDVIKQDLKQHIYYLKLGSEANNATCMANLGIAYILGRGIEKNPEIGIATIFKAVELGASKQAYAYVGYHLVNVGNGSEAIPFLEAAMEAGSGVAACNLALLYYTGDAGVNKDRTKAINIFRTAAQNSSDPKGQELAIKQMKLLGISKRSIPQGSKKKRR